MKRILFIILGIILCHAAQAQYKDIQRLPQPLRDSILIDVANKAIDKYSIGYLQPGREPIIEDIGVVSKDMLANRKDRRGLDWPQYYGVYFYAVYYKTTEEEKFYYSSPKDYLVKVFIRADNCRPVNIRYWDESSSRSGLDEDEEMARLVPEQKKKKYTSVAEKEEKRANLGKTIYHGPTTPEEIREANRQDSLKRDSFRMEHQRRYWEKRRADSLRMPDEERFPIYYGLAQVNMNLRDFDRCDYYFDLAGKYFAQMKPYEKHIYLNNRGNSYYYRQDYPKALDYFRRLLVFVNQYPDMKFERNMTMVNLGEVFLLMNQTDSATYYLNQCYAYFKEMENTSALYYIDTQLIELALKRGDLPLARKRLQEAVKPDVIDPNMLHIRNRYLQHYFEESGNFRQAYYYLKENNRIDDSTRNERIRMRVASIALRYQRDSTLMKKEMFIQQKENEVLRLNQWLYGGSLVVVLAGMCGFFIFLHRKKKRAKVESNLRTAITSLRLANIRNRISPHFIFNVLNREVKANRVAESDTNLNGLIKLIRRNLELADSLSVTLRDELDFVQTYVELESKTLQPDFVYTVEVDPQINQTNVKIPAMLLQIPIENAIKHGLRTKVGPKRLSIHICQHTDEIEIFIRDNGGGYRIGSGASGTGTGMKVITRTLQLLNAYNRRPIVMHINNVEMASHETGCEVYFRLPVDYSFELKKQKKPFYGTDI